MTKRARRVIIIAVLLPVAVILGLSITVYSLLQLSLPTRDGNEMHVELNEPVEIYFDSMGLPRILAQSDEDGYFAFGYLHASDRLFQMELIRRLSQGRIAELLGEIALKEDIRQRRFGHGRAATRALSQLKERDRHLLQSYADGVNAYLRGCRALPIEFYFLQADFAPWTVYDCLTILRFQTWFSDALGNRDNFFLEAAEAVGADKARRLLPVYPDWAPSTISRTAEVSSIPGNKKENVRKIGLMDLREGFCRSIYSSLFGEGGAPFSLTQSSNGWAISGERSRSGKPILASDPHLDITRLPQFWYFLGIHSVESQTSVIGISTPGLPFIVMGHNGQAAFCFTAAGIDNSDYYIEEVSSSDSSLYRSIEGWKQFEQVEDTIQVSGIDSPVIVTTRFTDNGPIIIENDSLKQLYSLHWAGFDSDLSQAVTSGFALHKVNSFEQFRITVSSLGALNANWIYADSSGNIGYQLGAPVPIRKEGHLNLPLPGWDKDNQWQGYYPPGMIPHEINPTKGWVGNCNNHPQAEGLPYDLQGNFFVDRILRLTELMNSKPVFDVQDIWRFQMDGTDLFLRGWAVLLADLIERIGEPKTAAMLRQWDGHTTLDSRETLLLETFFAQLIRMTFEDQIGEQYRKVRQIWMDQLYNSDDQFWFDNISTEQIETRDSIALKAAASALEICGDDAWGDRHFLTMQHPMAPIPVLGTLLGLKNGPFAWSGTPGTLNASFYKNISDSLFQSFVGPSWRFVIDFADVDNATIVLPAGNSGNPASEHFIDFFPMWRDGERWRVPFSYDAVRERAVSTLTLLPEASD